MMKKVIVWLVGFMILFCAASAQAKDEEEAKDSYWVWKASYDYFSIDSEVEDMPAMGTSSNTESYDIEGKLRGGTIYIGKVYLEKNYQFLLELSKRSGDLDGTAVYSNVTTSSIIERDDFEAKFTWQFMGHKTWQPFLGIGYMRMDTDSIETLESGWTWNSTGRVDRKIEKDVNLLSIGGGLGIRLGSVGIVSFGLRGDAYGLIGKGERAVEGLATQDDNALGYYLKGTGVINVGFPAGDGIFSIFADGGYQYQSLKFASSIGADIFSGLFGRIGVSYMF